MKYRVEKVDALENRKTIIALWQNNFPLLDGEKRFVWMYEQNPAGVPEVWLLSATDDAFIGMLALCKRQFFLAGKVIVAWQVIDFAVNQSHRALGPALQLQRHILREFEGNDVDFLYSFPNKRSKNVMKRAGYAEYGLFERRTLVLRPSYILQKYISNRKLANFTGWPCDVLYGAKLKLFARTTFSTESYVAELPEIHLEIDKIWRNRVGISSITGERSGQFLRWRFGDMSPLPAKCFLSLKNNTPHGYIAYYVNENHISIADFMVDSPDWIRPLFLSFIRYALREGCKSISVDLINFPFDSALFASIGFVKRPSDDCIVVFGDRFLRMNNNTKSEVLFATVADRDA
ncbi:MAG: GNAT family N-acetyltransferase [Desulfobulbaceae bacterium]|nr:MAG: GNAT family N-acetyltransferase [Desulfobulbaceae bacterium]